jgi:hypothetical protein
MFFIQQSNHTCCFFLLEDPFGALVLFLHQNTGLLSFMGAGGAGSGQNMKSS